MFVNAFVVQHIFIGFTLDRSKEGYISIFTHFPRPNDRVLHVISIEIKSEGLAKLPCLAKLLCRISVIITYQVE